MHDINTKIGVSEFLLSVLWEHAYPDYIMLFETFSSSFIENTNLGHDL